MAQNNRSRMSDALKLELAHDLGVADIVRRDGWGAVPTKQCGALVREAVRRAEAALRDNRRPWGRR